MATNRNEERQLEIFRGLRQEHYEDLKESDPQEAERYAANTIQVYLEGSDWPLLKDRKSREAATVSLGMYGVRTEWNHYRELLDKRGLGVWPLLERQRDYFEKQIQKAEEELHEMPVVYPRDPTATLEEKAAKEIREAIEYARMIFQRKLYVLRKVLRQWALTRHVPELTDKEAQAMAEVPVVNGYETGKEAARKAKAILREHRDKFEEIGDLIARMGAGGESKVDTLKRQTGYKDLSKEEKTPERLFDLIEKAKIA